MFDVGFWEMTLIGLIALLVLGPERLPKVARTAGLWLARARRMIADVRADVNREIRNSELKEMQTLKDSVKETADEFAASVGDASKSVEAGVGDAGLKDAIEEVAGSVEKAGGKP